MSEPAEAPLQRPVYRAQIRNAHVQRLRRLADDRRNLERAAPRLAFGGDNAVKVAGLVFERPRRFKRRQRVCSRVYRQAAFKPRHVLARRGGSQVYVEVDAFAAVVEVGHSAALAPVRVNQRRREKAIRVGEIAPPAFRILAVLVFRPSPPPARRAVPVLDPSGRGLYREVRRRVLRASVCEFHPSESSERGVNVAGVVGGFLELGIALRGLRPHAEARPFAVHHRAMGGARQFPLVERRVGQNVPSPRIEQIALEHDQIQDVIQRRPRLYGGAAVKAQKRLVHRAKLDLAGVVRLHHAARLRPVAHQRNRANRLAVHRAQRPSSAELRQAGERRGAAVNEYARVGYLAVFVHGYGRTPNLAVGV